MVRPIKQIDVFKVAPLLLKRFPDAVVGSDENIDYEETCYNLAAMCLEELDSPDQIRYFGEELHNADEFYDKITVLPNLMDELLNK